MTSIKIQDVINLQRKQTIRYNELKEEIYSKAVTKISNLAKNGQLKMLFNVPRYLFGYPAYKVNDVTEYINNKLTTDGFCTLIVGEDKIFISWDINDINASKIKKKKEKKKLIDLKPLLNIN